MAQKNEKTSEPMVRVISKRPGSIVLKSGVRLENDKCILITDSEYKDLIDLVGEEFIKRVD